MTALPVLYSFRRCPYAMRARMALHVSGQAVRLREVVLRDKPPEMIAISPKATVPVLQLEDGQVLEESLEIMLWALAQNDPQDWLEHRDDARKLAEQTETEFKHHLDRYKYPTRYENVDPLEHRASGLQFLRQLDGRIAENRQILGKNPGLADFAIFPFVRQFANTDRNWFDAQKLPALLPWLQGHLASDIFAAIMAKYPQWKTGDEEPRFGP
ncbi:Glutathione S-transferase [Parasphingorhabdus marina DSM 22363]|uniref:Glutathione S-transferase n=1 Tax=Parasphingorhabdus marina DSM 22363 TaxID=1123272 RepID=A0A1N6CNL7_9SPHN|nr:glutathione S-transferase [Parasphingorhabdus marina]SIN60096.1 Glutathione S-transferase [Parasphingorhabdus marina DSM 22363]